MIKIMHNLIEKLYFSIPGNLALYDQLTGLYNYNWLNIHRCEFEKMDCYITMIDINNFKQINDEKGHLYANGILKAVGAKLNDLKTYDDSCTAARFGGDEFIVISSKKLNDYILFDDNGLLSIGVYHKTHDVSLAIAVNLADEYMYEFKKNLKKKNNQ